MRILYLLQDLPYPPTNGVRVKLFNLISYMARYHECHILSFADKDLLSRAEELQQKVPRIKILDLFPLNSGFTLHLKRLYCLLSRKPLFLARYNNNAFAKAVRKAFETTHYDVVHIDALGMAPYVHFCQPTPTVLSTTDAVSLAQSRRGQTIRMSVRKIYRLLASRSTARFECKMLPLFTKVHVVSKPDRDYLQLHIPTANIECIEHVVPDDVLQYPDKNPDSPSGSRRILFTGSLRRDGVAKGLLTFLARVYPVIREEFSDVEMIVLGGTAPVSMRKQLKNVPGVRLVEWVEDYCAEIMKAQVVICPDWSGTGIKTCILYALALGKPVVASPVALEGIDIQDGVHCYERKVDGEFAESVLALLKDERLRHKIGQNARRLIVENYNTRLSGSKWHRLYTSTVSVLNEQ